MTSPLPVGWLDMKASVCRFPLVFAVSLATLEAEPRVYEQGALPADRRLGSLKDLNGHFPFAVPASRSAWEERAEILRRRVLVANGLWPLPERTPLNAVIHGRIARPGFMVEKVYFESLPGFYVTGLLFRPDKGQGPFPAVLSPHGHGGRLQDHGPKKIRQHIVGGAERFEGSGRFPKVARCAQLARMGCVTFLYDMIGYADNRQISYELAHRFTKQRPEADTPESWGLYSTQAELRLQGVMGLQTWNSIRALDFLAALPGVDAERIGVTGGSGGGTQTIILCAIDPRPRVAFPQGMVSTSMQGGCTCENTSLLRIGTGNVEVAALFAPKALAMTAADDWTRAMMTDGFPELQKLYHYYEAKDAVACKSLTHFPHNYNYVTRALMYQWFNRHLVLGLDEPIVEEDFEPLTAEEHAVWNEDHPEPEGGDAFERQLTKWMAKSSDDQMRALLPNDADALSKYRETVGGAMEILIGRQVPARDDITQVSVSQAELATANLSLGKIELETHGEEVPVVVILPRGKPSDDFVLWLDGEGKSALARKDGSIAPHAASLVAAGRPVVAADLFGQGEFTKEGTSLGENRVVDNPREFAGYTYGYNDALFAQRVHDILTIIGAMARDAGTISVVGTNGAGPWVAAACAMAGDEVTHVALDTGGFRFRALTHYRDENFLPGALKYGDLPAMIALGATRPLWLGGEPVIPDLVARAYSASGSEAKIHLAPEAGSQAIADWLLAL